MRDYRWVSQLELLEMYVTSFPYVVIKKIGAGHSTFFVVRLGHHYSTKLIALRLLMKRGLNSVGAEELKERLR